MDVHGLDKNKPMKEKNYSAKVKCPKCKIVNVVKTIYRGNTGMSYIIRIETACYKCGNMFNFTDHISFN